MASIDVAVQTTPGTEPLAQAQLRVALDNLPGAIVYTDDDLNIVFCNGRFSEMYSVPPALLEHGRPYPAVLRYLAEHGYYGAGDPAAQVCGWLKDKYGLSWQIVPEKQLKLIGNPKSAKSQRAFAEMMRRKKPDLAAVQRAYDG